MSDKILESGTVHVQDIQMGKKKISDVKIANDEVLFIIFYQGRGIINAFGEEIFMSEKEYVMIHGATGRDKISVHAEYPQIMITFTGLFMSETIMRGCLKNQSMKIVSMLINEINEKQFGYIHNCESLINMLLILLHRERNQTSERLTDSERRNYCEKVNSYVQKHYLESPQMEFLANKFGYDGNAQMLRRDFIRYYGTTPAAISKIKKMEEAKRLLATTTYSMKEIAVKLKYKSHTHFGMDFKNNIGMTPAEYRKAIKAKREKQMNTKDYQMNLKDYLAKMC